MRMLEKGRLAGLAAVGFSLAMLGSAHAQSVEEFYKGKTVSLVISAATGGSTDFFARAFAPYFAKHIPGNPQVVVTNQPGAGGMVAASQLQNNERRDGTVVTVLQRNNFYASLLSGQDKGFDPRKVNWIGSLNKEQYIISAWQTAPVKTPEDIFTTPMRMGATSFSNETRTIPAMMNEYLGAKFDIVAGYTGSEEIALAMERQEVDGKAGTSTNVSSGNEAAWVREGKLKLLMQVGLTSSPAFPDVPNVMSYVKDPDVKLLFNFMLAPFDAGRPLAVPPEVPEDRLAALRKAFDEAVADPDFLADMKKVNTPVEPVTGQKVEEIIASLYATPEPVLANVRKLLIPQ